MEFGDFTTELLNGSWMAAGILAVYLGFLISAIGAFIPVIPGPTFGFLVLLLFKLCVPEAQMSWWTVSFMALLAILAQLMDIVLSWVGAKKFGSTWRGALGAVLGAIVGVFIPPPIIWIFIAPLVLAAAFEYLGGADIRASSLAGIGAFLGTLAASIFKFFVVVIMAIVFTASVVSMLASY